MTVLLSGPGMFLLQSTFENITVIDDVSRAFRSIIEEEKTAGSGGGDHFAIPGANDRISNALEELCLRTPNLY